MRRRAEVLSLDCSHLERDQAGRSRSCFPRTRNWRTQHQAAEPHASSKWAPPRKARSWLASASSTSTRAQESALGRLCRQRRRRRKVRAIPPRRSQLEGGSATSTGRIRLLTGPSRSNSQQEFKWAWEQMMDEMAEAVRNGPGEISPAESPEARDQGCSRPGRSDARSMPETENGFLTYDCYAGTEVLEEGAKAIGWESGIQCPAATPEDSRQARGGDVPASRGPRRLSGRRGAATIGFVATSGSGHGGGDRAEKRRQFTG